MADFSITLTVPNADVQALVDAINWNDPNIVGGVDTPRTAAQCRTWFHDRSVMALKDIVRRHRQYRRDQQAIAADPDIT